MKEPKRRSDCPISYALDQFGGRWCLIIVRDLVFKEKSSYGEFLKSEEKIATNILADRLHGLENAGIIIKSQDPEHGSRFIYKLSKKGMDLVPILVEIILWSSKYDENTGVEMKFVNRAKRQRQGLLNEIAQHLKKKFAVP